MLWRPYRISQFLSKRAIPNQLAAARLRPSSTLRISNPSIATILASPPALDEHIVKATGSVRTIRNQKHRSFVELGDGSTTQSLQAVLEPAQAEGCVSFLAFIGQASTDLKDGDSLGTGTSVEITGVWQSAPPGKEQSHELKAEKVKILGVADAEKYPIQKKYHSAEYLRSLPHLRLRTPLNALLARIRSESDFCIATFFRNQGFVRLQPPIITSSDCEGAGEVFAVSSKRSSPPALEATDPSRWTTAEFFKTPKFLTVSSQLHLEAFVHEHQGVWTLSPTFRAEKSDTPRHVSEFWMLEVEMRTENLRDVMDLVEDMIRSLTISLQDLGMVKELIFANRGCGKSTDGDSSHYAELLNRRWEGLKKSSWARITYQEAVRRLQDATKSKTAKFEYEPSWSTGLQLEHEKYIAATIGQGSPVFVTDYPQSTKPFYMLPSLLKDNDPGSVRHVACFDLLLPDICEVVGGSLREHRLPNLHQSMHNQGLDVLPSGSVIAYTNGESTPSSEKGNLDWYVDLRRYGSVPHGGFGLGFDRLLGYLAGIGNIKDVVPWPRYHGRCDC